MNFAREHTRRHRAWRNSRVLGPSRTFRNHLPLLGTSVMVGRMITPNDIANELQITGKVLRDFLREPSNGFARSPAQHGQRYQFNRRDVDEIKRAYRAKDARTAFRPRASTS
jgi:hypothetical protein